MSVYQSDKAYAAVGAQVDKPDAREAESIIAAFLVALGELGIEAPANTYRAVVTRQGLEVEVFDDAGPTVTHYGTPAPVEEISEFLGEALRRDPVDGEALTAEELDALRVGYRVRDREGDQWEKDHSERWYFVLPHADVPGSHSMRVHELVSTWGPLTRADS